MIELERRSFLKGISAALGMGAVVAAGLEPGADEVLDVPKQPEPEPERMDRPTEWRPPRLVGTKFGPLTEEQAIKCLVEMAGKREYPRIRVYPCSTTRLEICPVEWYVELLT